MFIHIYKYIYKIYKIIYKNKLIYKKNLKEFKFYINISCKKRYQLFSLLCTYKKLFFNCFLNLLDDALPSGLISNIKHGIVLFIEKLFQQQNFAHDQSGDKVQILSLYGLGSLPYN